MRSSSTMSATHIKGFRLGLEGTPTASVMVTEEIPPVILRDSGACGVPADLGVGLDMAIGLGSGRSGGSAMWKGNLSVSVFVRSSTRHHACDVRRSMGTCKIGQLGPRARASLEVLQ